MKRNQLPPSSFLLLILLFIFSTPLVADSLNIAKPLGLGDDSLSVAGINTIALQSNRASKPVFTDSQSNTVTPGGMLYIWPIWPELPLNSKRGFYNYDIHLKINEDPGEDSSYFWANQFHFLDGDGGYIGLQTNGFMQGQWVGKMAIFSIWQALEAIPGPNANCEWFGHEGEGLSCRMPYQWQENHDYKLRVWVLHTDQSSNEWWGAWVVDNVTGQESYVGKILVPSSSPFKVI